MEKIKRPAIFLDRDGVLIVERDFLVDPDDVEFYPETIEALAAVKNDYMKIVISNQSGIARGYFSSEDVERVNSEISRMLGDKGIFIDAWFFCPHGPGDGCSCRKPRPGMILEAAERLNIDLEKSWIIGDKSSDIEAGKASGIKTIMVNTGYGGSEPGASKVDPHYTASNIGDAIEYINRSST
ncbi:MAG: HAD family hydrolase [Candidatus Zixiibacteriota bacterium]|nr:MAG: HAD family hydrolase [candidate division Zixibacteria bacterium]